MTSPFSSTMVVPSLNATDLRGFRSTSCGCRWLEKGGVAEGKDEVGLGDILPHSP